MHLKNNIRRIRKRLLAPFDRALRRIKIAAERFVIKTISKHGVASDTFSGSASESSIPTGMGSMQIVKQMFALLKANSCRENQPTESFKAVALGDGLLLVSHPHVGHMYADLSDVVLVPHLVVGIYEELTTITLETTLRPGDTVVHFGEEQGYHLLTIAHLIGSAGRIVAVEAPFPSRALELNIRAHQLESLVTVVSETAQVQRVLDTQKSQSSRLVVFVSENKLTDSAHIPELSAVLTSRVDAVVIAGTCVTSAELFMDRIAAPVYKKLASAA